MKLNRLLIPLFAAAPLFAMGQKNYHLSYRIGTEATFSNGDNAPYWLTANKFGLGGTEKNNFYFRAGADWNKSYRHGWKLAAGLDLAAGYKTPEDFWFQQAYFDVSWKVLTLSIGSKERVNSPLDKNADLTSGWMTEGINTLPIPQIRAEIRDYYSIPFTGHWLSIKGHLAYGAFLDGDWQEKFTIPGQVYVRDVKYHSKALMFRVGKKETFPLEFELGLHMATQFAGDQMRKLENGGSELLTDMPDGFINYVKALIPSQGGSDTPWGEQANIEGNMMGSWNVAFNYYLDDWKFRVYLDHYFEDKSQMFWSYGRWKDGQIGLQVDFPKNRWVSSFVWEGLCTTDQTGPLLYEGYVGSFGGLKASGNDDYFNHYIYQAWQYYGMGMGAPLLPGPAFFKDGGITFRSNRMKGQHFGLQGTPIPGLDWRVLASFTRHWGTYSRPLDSVKHQFYGMAEVKYTPKRFSKFTFKAALGVDNGDYIGNSVGGTVGVQMRIGNN